MANAKLSGSLLAYRDVPLPTTPAQPLPSVVSADEALANHFETVKSGLQSTDGAVAARIASAAERLGPSSPATVGNRRFGPIVRLSLVICGVAASTAIGAGLFMQATGHSGATIAPQLGPAPTTVSGPPPTSQAPVPAAETEVAGSGMAAPVTSAQTESPIASAMSAAPTNPAAVANEQPLAAAGPAPAPMAQAPAAHLPPEEVAALLARGDALLGSGDVVSARLCYERAAEGGNAQAALRLGETYDPSFLTRAHLNGVRGDATAAMRWYQHALRLGAAEAQTLLTAVATNDDATKRSKEMNLLFEQFLARRDGQTR